MQTEVPAKEAGWGWKKTLAGAVAASAALVLVSAAWWGWATRGVQQVYRAVAPAATSASAPTVEQLGQVGDLFGGINALFAAMAAVGAFLAVYLQRRALIETRQALQHERVFNSRQQFEGTFFQLLQLCRDVMQTIADGDKQGARVLESWAAGLESKVRSINVEDLNLYLVDLAIAYEREVYLRHPSALGPYFRLLYQTFKLIDEMPDSIVSRDEKTRYANIARGQISEGAILLLALAAVTPRGERFVPLIETYGLLEHMHGRYMGRYRKALDTMYQPSAFMGSLDRQQAQHRDMADRIRDIREKVADGIRRERMLTEGGPPDADDLALEEQGPAR